MTFDIRMVGRPPVVTQFMAGGPGFLSFLNGEVRTNKRGGGNKLYFKRCTRQNNTTAH